jgi:hypothetical protein
LTSLLQTRRRDRKNVKIGGRIGYGVAGEAGVAVRAGVSGCGTGVSDV